MAFIRTKFSERQMGGGVAVDVLAGSPQARRRIVTIPINSAIISTAIYASFTAVTACKVVNCYITYPVLPLVAGGTQTVSVDILTTAGSSANMVAATSTLNNFTAMVARDMTLVNTTLAAGQSVVATFLTSNNAPTVNTGVGGSVSFLLEPTEDAVISDTDTTIPNA